MAREKPSTYWRGAHGAAREGGAIVVNESKPWDEAPAASPAITARPGRGADGKFLPGNGVARSKKVRPSNHGALTALEAKGDPIWQSCNRWGKRYGSHRREELTRLHGGELSAGVSAMIESAAQALADARYLRAKAAEMANAELTKVAHQIAKDARQAERDAWSLAALESAARPTNVRDALTARILATKGEST